MNWGDLASVIGGAAPMLGRLIAGPAGAAVGSMVASALGVEDNPSAVSEALKVDPEAAVKLAQIEASRTVELQTLLVQAESARLAAETAGILAVNATMQAEAGSERWPQYSWRPYCGFIFGTTFFGVYFVLPLLKMAVPTVPTEAWLAIGAVLGVASWFRGQAQATQAANTASEG